MKYILFFGIDTSMMPYMSDDGMSEDSSVVGMPQGRTYDYKE